VPHGVRVTVAWDLIDQVTLETTQPSTSADYEPDIKAPVERLSEPLEEVRLSYGDRVNLLLTLSRVNPGRNVWIGSVRDENKYEDTSFVLETGDPREAKTPSPPISAATVATLIWAISCNGGTKKELYNRCYMEGIPRCEENKGELTGVDVLIDASASADECQCKANCTY